MGSLSDDQRTVGEHYDGPGHEYELTRLEQQSPVEHAMMERYLARFVPDNSVVADVGVGAGHYDESLARRGCGLYLADVSSRLLDAALERLKARGLSDRVLDARLASATDLSHLDSGCCDAVLMLGPLYHLLTLAERRQAVTEARRVLRSDGVFMAAGCNRVVGLASGYLLDPETCVELRASTGASSKTASSIRSWPPLSGMRTSPPSPSSVPCSTMTSKSCASPASSPLPRPARISSSTSPGETQQTWLDFVEATASRPEGLAMSGHLLFVGRPRQA